MKCWVIGAGSIGSRRAMILAGMGHEVVVSDIDHSRAEHVGSLSAYIHPVSISEIRNDWVAFHKVRHAAVFICTPPMTDRAAQVSMAMEYSPRGIFIEKPIALDLESMFRVEQAMALPGSLGEPTIPNMVACNLRFSSYGRKLAAKTWDQVHLHMHLAPEFWNPNHRPVSLILDSIHELDLALSLSREARVVGFSHENVCEVSLHHDNRSSHISMQRAGNKRFAKVFDRDGVEKTIHFNSDTGHINLMYQSEMIHFMWVCSGRSKSVNPISKAMRTHAIAFNIMENTKSLS